MTPRETIMLNFIEFLLRYAARAAMHQVYRDDLVKLKTIRAFVKQLKTETENV